MAPGADIDYLGGKCDDDLGALSGLDALTEIIWSPARDHRQQLMEHRPDITRAGRRYEQVFQQGVAEGIGFATGNSMLTIGRWWWTGTASRSAACWPRRTGTTPPAGPTLDKLEGLGPLPGDIRVHLDAGYDSQKTRDDLADAIVAVLGLIRQAWATYRWDGRPTRRP